MPKLHHNRIFLIAAAVALLSLPAINGCSQSNSAYLAENTSADPSVSELLINDRNVLSQWAEQGLALSRETYRQLAPFIREDIQKSRAAFAAIQDSYEHRPRFFDPDWLQNPLVHLNLTGVILRPDHPIIMPDGVCGEIRLLYRLNYQGAAQGDQSDLPLTVVQIFPLKSSSPCDEALAQMTDHLATHNFAAIKSATSGRPAAVEYNFQTNRYPNDGTDFSNQAHYALAALHYEDGNLTRSPLENTPDLHRLASDPEQTELLWHWIQDNLDAIDQGRYQIPDKFLAGSAQSVTPNGALRLSNRPFQALFQGDHFSSPELTDRVHIKNKAQLLRRLDSMTCTGCHTTASVAGFHYLGQVRNRDGYFNRMVEPFSTYFKEIQGWRNQIIQEPDLPKPTVDRVVKGMGAACGHPGGDFAEWTCDSGLQCATAFPTSPDNPVGQCLQAAPKTVGKACDIAELKSGINPLADKWQHYATHQCDGLMICTKGVHGFPGGFCTTGCGADDSLSGRCSKIPTLGPFTECLEAGGRFADCLANNHSQVLMPECSSNTDCRTDYVCAATEAGGKGICAPPYFMHQLTIENHPLVR